MFIYFSVDKGERVTQVTGHHAGRLPRFVNERIVQFSVLNRRYTAGFGMFLYPLPPTGQYAIGSRRPQRYRLVLTDEPTN